MPRATVYLGEASGQALVKGTWKYARGYVPGQPNEGLVEQIEGSPARLADYDDSGWETCHDLAERMSHGFSFMWYRINVTFPEEVDGHPVKGVRVQFETCIDDYGEIWIDGECDRDRGVIQGFNVPQRVLITADATPGEQHTIALLAANGPLAAPGGTVFCRYANLAFEWTGV
ncbi:MAG: hypothetical protein IIB32_08735 [Chloroflexi bacterium]|nr:hypothetical protein [Chloroflexota bacterium]